MKTDDLSIQEEITILMKRKHIKIGEMADYLGVTTAYLSNYLHATRSCLNLEQILKICEKLEIPFEDLAEKFINTCFSSSSHMRNGYGLNASLLSVENGKMYFAIEVQRPEKEKDTIKTLKDVLKEEQDDMER